MKLCKCRHRCEFCLLQLICIGKFVMKVKKFKKQCWVIAEVYLCFKRYVLIWAWILRYKQGSCISFLHLSVQVRKHVNDLYEDLRDGHNLISLLEVLSGDTLVSFSIIMQWFQIVNYAFSLFVNLLCIDCCRFLWYFP